MLSSRGLAAAGGDDILVAGTTAFDSQARDWAYLVWQTGDPASLRGRQFAIYSKPGDANAAAAYTRQAIVGVVTDPVVIEPLLQRSVHLGQDLAYLNDTVNNLFELLMPDPKLPLAHKLSAVIGGSLDNPDHFKNLVLMARTHPGVSLCLGWGHAQLIPGPAGTPTTFELRAYDGANNRDLGVIGRSTVRARQPILLPAPGAPVEVHDITPKGDLNAKMRWATPDALRRVSMLQHGFNLYRVPASYAESHSWHLAPPTIANLRAAMQENPSIRRLNRVPVLNPRDYTQAEALDFIADPGTFFYSDWNDRFNPNTKVPQDDFVNGAQFFYFVSARDLLGRDGQLSPGTRMTICDRMPPGAPQRVRVVNHYAYAGSSEQHLQVIWNQNENTNDTTTAYLVYRWTSLPHFHQNAVNPAVVPIAGPILHLEGSQTNSYLDNGAGAPSAATQAGVTFWYTVVAIDAGACAPGENRGPHSAPAYGVLRDRVGPTAPDGTVEITCTTPEATFEQIAPELPAPDLSTNSRHYRLVASRNRPAILWAEFYYDIPGKVPDRTYIDRRLFVPGQSDVSTEFALPNASLGVNPTPPRFFCRVGAANGKVSNFAITTTSTGITPIGFTRPVHFSSTLRSQRTRPGGDCDVHDPHGGDDADGIDPICVSVALTPGTKEVKFYRRLENGPLTLVCQEEADFAGGAVQAACCDGSMPAQPSEICYFVQAFDEHGNASAMVRLRCIKTAPNAPLPTPVLSPIGSLGNSDNARMSLQWFCPPYGVERFEVWMTGNPLPPGKGISADLTLTNTIELGLPLPGVLPPQPQLLTFLSRRIGPSFGNGAVFTTEADVIPGNKYALFVRAVGKDGSVGPQSNVEQFSWRVTPETPTTNVPWPARSLPAVTLTNFPGVTARLFHTNDAIFGPYHQQRFEGVGIRVGAVTMTAYPPAMTNAIAGTADPLQHLYRSARDQGPLFPLALYRTQVPNPIFPEVSGEMVQVSPLMEQIAFDRGVAFNGANTVFVQDPFIRLVPAEPTTGQTTTAVTNWELYLLDTQPVVEDAVYQYFLVRLDADTREIYEVMPTNPVPIVP